MTIDEISLCLAQQPLHRLQKVAGLVDQRSISLRRHVPARPRIRSTLRTHGDAIELKPGRRSRSCAAGRSAQAGAGDHVGRGRAPHEQVPRRGSAGRGRPSLRPANAAALTAVREPFKEAFGPTASIAGRTCRRTIRSITYCRGRWWESTGWRIWCWRAHAATATRAGRCLPSGLSTACWHGRRTCWRRSRPSCNGPLSVTGW